MTSQSKEEIEALMKQLRKIKTNNNQGLLKEKHIQYLNKVLHGLGQSIIHFDVAQPWIYYYIVHCLCMLDSPVSKQDRQLIIKSLRNCRSQGFAGGYLQVPHLAPTYASFLTIIELGPEAYDLIDKQELYTFFKKIKKGNRFQMHEYGECDLRGSYIVIIIVKLLGLNQDVLEGVAENIVECQTYEGGISNQLGGQAHGGFTFCGIAGLAAMGKLQNLDISRLTFWLSQRQVQFGGFNGRTSKLLDSCYSFWVGSAFNLINDYFQGKCNFQNTLLYCQEDLQRYILLYCQDEKSGGLFDKPGKPKDIYHSCYALSGLSLSQHKIQYEKSSEKQKCQKGPKLIEIDSIYNVTKKQLQAARQYFSSQKQK